MSIKSLSFSQVHSESHAQCTTLPLFSNVATFQTPLFLSSSSSVFFCFNKIITFLILYKKNHMQNATLPIFCYRLSHIVFNVATLKQRCHFSETACFSIVSSLQCQPARPPFHMLRRRLIETLTDCADSFWSHFTLLFRPVSPLLLVALQLRLIVCSVPSLHAPPPLPTFSFNCRNIVYCASFYLWGMPPLGAPSMSSLSARTPPHTHLHTLHTLFE